jgi:transcriptional regulator of met regulon
MAIAPKATAVLTKTRTKRLINNHQLRYKANLRVGFFISAFTA